MPWFPRDLSDMTVFRKIYHTFENQWVIKLLHLEFCKTIDTEFFLQRFRGELETGDMAFHFSTLQGAEGTYPKLQAS